MKPWLLFFVLGLLGGISAYAQTPVGPGSPSHFLAPSNSPLGSYATLAALETAWPSSQLSSPGGQTAFVAGAVSTCTAKCPVYWDGSAWQIYSTGGGTGTVTSVSVAPSNGFTGTVANPTTTPAITLQTIITGMLYGSGTALSQATALEIFEGTYPVSGIVPDGSTDNTTALTAAIAYSIANGGICMVLPPGTISIPNGITTAMTAQQAACLRGQERFGTTIISTNTTNSTLAFTATVNSGATLNMTDVLLKGNAAATGGADLSVTGLSTVVLDHVYLKNGYNGYAHITTTSASLHDLYGATQTNDTFFIQGSSDVRCVDCSTFEPGNNSYELTTSTAGTGIPYDTGGFHLVASNSGKPGNDGILIDPATGGNVYDVWLDNDDFDSSQGEGPGSAGCVVNNLGGTGVVFSVHFTNDRCSYGAGAGVLVLGAYPQVSDITFDNMMVRTNRFDGYDILGGGMVSITGGNDAGNGIQTNTATIASVAITGTAGQISCTCTNLEAGQLITISGTYGGTGSITGYTNPTTYYVSATNGTSTATLETLGLAALTTTAGTPTGLTYTLDNDGLAVGPASSLIVSSVHINGAAVSVTNTTPTATQAIGLHLLSAFTGTVAVSPSMDISGNTSAQYLNESGVNPNASETLFNGYFSSVYAGASAVIGWTTKGQMSSPAAGVVQLGGTNSSSPVNYTFQGQGALAGTASNTAGANVTAASGDGTGNATGSTYLIQTPHTGSTGTGAQTLINQLSLQDTANSIGNTTSNPTFDAYGTGLATFHGAVTASGGAINLDNGVSGAYAVNINGSTSTGSTGIGNGNGGTTTIAGPFTASGGSIDLTGIASNTGAQTGYLCWASSNGRITYDGTNTCLVSARKFKKDIKDLTVGLNEVLKLQPVSFYYKAPFPGDVNMGKEQIGFIADDVEKVEPRLVTHDKNGDIHGVRYEQMTALLVKAVQDQQREIAVLQAEVNELRRTH